MMCPKCSSLETGVTDSRPVESAIRRRRRCCECGERFTTYELDAAEIPGFAVKADGRVNPNTRRIAAEIADIYAGLGPGDAALLISMARRLSGKAAEAADIITFFTANPGAAA